MAVVRKNVVIGFYEHVDSGKIVTYLLDKKNNVETKLSLNFDGTDNCSQIIQQNNDIIDWVDGTGETFQVEFHRKKDVEKFMKQINSMIKKNNALNKKRLKDSEFKSEQFVGIKNIAWGTITLKNGTIFKKNGKYPSGDILIYGTQVERWDWRKPETEVITSSSQIKFIWCQNESQKNPPDWAQKNLKNVKKNDKLCLIRKINTPEWFDTCKQKVHFPGITLNAISYVVKKLDDYPDFLNKHVIISRGFNDELPIYDFSYNDLKSTFNNIIFHLQFCTGDKLQQKFNALNNGVSSVAAALIHTTC